MTVAANPKKVMLAKSLSKAVPAVGDADEALINAILDWGVSELSSQEELILDIMEEEIKKQYR